MTLHKALISAGSNLPGKRGKLADACRGIAARCHHCRISQVVESADITGRGAPYANVALEITTPLTQDALEALLRDLETQGGRTPGSKTCGVMPLDLDLVQYDGRTVSLSDCDAPYFRACLALLPND